MTSSASAQMSAQWALFLNLLSEVKRENESSFSKLRKVLDCDDCEINSELIHLLVISLLVLVVFHPELVEDRNKSVSSTSVNAAPFDNNLSVGDAYCYQFVRERKWTSEDRFIGLLLTMGSFFVAILLVYGAVKGHAGYLMPFFCLQVFDFSVGCLTVVGYFSYLPNLKHCIAVQSWVPYKDQLMAMDGDWLMMMAILFFVLVLALKAYFLGVVWACYKYLCMGSVRGLVRTSGHDYAAGGEDAEMLLPPKYEDAIQMSNEQPPPPPYFAN